MALNRYREIKQMRRRILADTIRELNESDGMREAEKYSNYFTTNKLPHKMHR